MKTKKYFSFIMLLFLSFTILAQQSMLDLSQPEQQKDFLKYLKATISMLEDTSMKRKMKGYPLNNLSDSNKQQIANKMIEDTAFFKRLNDYFAYIRTFENKYHISQFSKEELDEVIRFGASNGIYFISSMNKHKGQKDTLPFMPYNIPRVTPFKNPADTLHSPGFHQK